MNKIYLFFCMCVFFTCCNNSENNKSETVEEAATSDTSTLNKASPLAGCYLMIQQRDTAIMNLDVYENSVSGKLEYKRFEKDRNEGTVSGMIDDSLLIANYTFQSEGMRSTREVVFLIKGASLFEGYGEIITKDDTARFVNSSQLQFMPKPFIKVDCAGR